MVHMPAPSIAPLGSINHVTAVSPWPRGRSSFCILHISLLEKKKKIYICMYFSCSLEIRQGTTNPMAVLEPQEDRGWRRGH